MVVLLFYINYLNPTSYLKQYMLYFYDHTIEIKILFHWQKLTYYLLILWMILQCYQKLDSHTEDFKINNEIHYE